MTAVEPWQGNPSLIRTPQQAIRYFQAAQGVLGVGFTDAKTGQVDWAAVEVSCLTALENGLALISNVPKMPVIRGRVYPMAEVWRVAAHRHGWNVDIVEDEPDRCTVQLSKGDRRPAPMTVTMAEATTAGWTSNALYKSDARAMLRARTTMRAIKLHCPEVMAGPIGDTMDAGPAAPVSSPREVPAGPDLIDEPDRAYLIDRTGWLAEHQPDIFTWLRAVWKAAERPNLRAPELTAADGRLLRTLLQFPGPASGEHPPARPDASSAEAPAGPGPDPLTESYDSDPESRNYEYDEDDGRPFDD